jgi:uncharacterized cupredoxin-like copper-binding protein
MRALSAAAVGAAGAVLLASCGGSSASRVAAAAPPLSSTTTATTAVPSTTIKVSEGDFHITADTAVVAAGNVAIAITNVGPSAHELLAFRTDLPADQLPLGPEGRINEDALPKALDTGTDLPPGTQRPMAVPLTPGRYVLVCNLPGHYKLGMHFVITVK